MDRRGFFSSLSKRAAVAGAGTAVVLYGHESTQDAPDKFERLGWKYTWSPPTAHFCDAKAGWWTAYNSNPVVEEEKYEDYQGKGYSIIRGREAVYSTTTGNLGWFNRGDMFNVCMVEGREWITSQTPPEVIAQERSLALSRLIKFIDTWEKEQRNARP